MESSVTSLMDHLNGVETRRRVVMMKSKEAETRLGFAHEEQQRLQQLSTQNEAREAELKKELEHLLAEQQQLQLQVAAGVDAVRQGGVEESLLIEHARGQAERAGALVDTWHGHVQGLEELQRAWAKDEAAAPMQRRIAELDNEVATLNSEKERLEQAVKEVMKAQALRSGGIAASATQSGDFAAQQTETGDDSNATVIQLREQFELGLRELEELRAHHTRQLAAVDREIADLNSRSTELAQWLTDTVTLKEQVLQSTRVLQACLNMGVCAFCRTSS